MVCPRLVSSTLPLRNQQNPGSYFQLIDIRIDPIRY
jgi:hypothetical protein